MFPRSDGHYTAIRRRIAPGVRCKTDNSRPRYIEQLCQSADRVITRVYMRAIRLARSTPGFLPFTSLARAMGHAFLVRHR